MLRNLNKGHAQTDSVLAYCFPQTRQSSQFYRLRRIFRLNMVRRSVSLLGTVFKSH